MNSYHYHIYVTHTKHRRLLIWMFIEAKTAYWDAKSV